MLSPDGKQAVLMSFCDSAEPAEIYVRDGYARVLAAPEPLIEGTPVLSTYDAISSTAYKIRAGAAGA